jgi:hypothetical protein
MEDAERYQQYLCSREWAEKKNAVHERSFGRCERCGLSKAAAVHHLTYIRKYNERLEDLQNLCKACHEYIHDKSDYDPCDPPIKNIKLSFAKINNNLLCPSCDGDFLHSTYTHKEISNIIVGFWCEGCHVKLELVLKQHEGWTFLEWQKAPFKTKPKD